MNLFPVKFARISIFLLYLFSNVVNAQQKPNVLFIAIDDLNDYVNFMGGSIKAYTPNIDKLADEGVAFVNAHCQAPICGPSRASIMTGLYPANSGNYLFCHDEDIKKSNSITKQAIFLDDYFELNGYESFGVGKIFHYGDQAKTFDHFGGIFDSYGPYPKERFKYDPSKIPGKSGNTVTDWGAFPSADSLMTDYKVANWAINKLNSKIDKPFFMAVGFTRPHVPWYAPQKWFDMFPKDSIKTPPYLKSDFDDIPDFAKKVANVPMMPTTEEMIKSGEWKDIIQAYLACTAFVDHQVGKVLSALENSKYANNTIIVLWSDHGYHLGEKNRFAKQALWERDTRAPLIFKLINSKNKGQVVDKPVQLIDIYPTLLDACNLPPYKLADGNSLYGLINNDKKKWNHKALSFYGEGNIAVRGSNFRLIQYEDGSLELYDMKKDPNEWHNLAKNPAYRSVIKDLQKEIPKKWAPISLYSFYKVNPYFRSKTANNKK